MRRGVLIQPIGLLVAHTIAAGNLAGGPRLVNGAGQGTVAKGFGPVPSLFGIPMVDDDLHRHRTAPHTTLTVGIVSLCRQAPVSALPINLQWGRKPVPGCITSHVLSAPQDSQFADPIEVDNFQPRVHHWVPDSLQLIADAESVFGMGSGAHADSKFTSLSAYSPRDPQEVPQIGVASLVERAGQADSWLDRSDVPYQVILSSIARGSTSGGHGRLIQASTMSAPSVKAERELSAAVAGSERWTSAACRMRSVVVVIILKISQFRFQIRGGPEKRPVQILAPDCANQSLYKRMR